MKNRIGERWMTNQGYWITIIECFGAHNCTIQFDNGHIIKGRAYDLIRKGIIANPFHPSVFGVGYVGVGKYSSKNKIASIKWKSMLKRSYNIEYKTKNPTYRDVTVCKEWECFQVFAEWFYKDYKEGYVLDKDILLKGNKIYSPETCCIIPQEINILFVKCDSRRGKCPVGVKAAGRKFSSSLNKHGDPIYLGTFDTKEEAFQVYKIAKEEWIKEVADEWKDRIEPEVYNAMYAYEVEITD